MFLLQYALEVKMGEKTRLETTLKVVWDFRGFLIFCCCLRKRKQESGKKKQISNWLNKPLIIFYKKMTGKQWKRRKSKKSGAFPLLISILFKGLSKKQRITFENDEHIKTVEAEILQLKAYIYNLKVEKRFIIQICHFGFRMCFANIPCMASF